MIVAIVTRPVARALGRRLEAERHALREARAERRRLLERDRLPWLTNREIDRLR